MKKFNWKQSENIKETKIMLYDYIISNYKEGEPIFFSDIFIISNHQV